MRLLGLKKHNRLFNIGTDRSDFFEEIVLRGISPNTPPPPSRVKLISNANKEIGGDGGGCLSIQQLKNPQKEKHVVGVQRQKWTKGINVIKPFIRLW